MAYLMGYCSRRSVRPGDTVEFKVSCDAAPTFEAEIIRVLAPAAGPKAPPPQAERVETPVNRSYPARYQRMQAGSCIAVPPDPAFDGLAGVTAMILIWPTRLAAGRQGLIGAWSETEQRGFGLMLGADGAPEVRIGHGGGAPFVLSTGVPCLERCWYLIAASVDAATGRVQLFQEPLGTHSFDHLRPVHVTGTAPAPDGLGLPLVIGAWGSGTAERPTSWRHQLFGGHFNGKLEAPKLLRGALDRDGIREAAGGARTNALLERLIAAWDFSREIPGDRAVDTAGGLHGDLVNLPTRAVTGTLWDGSVNCWTQRPEHYGAIHFHDDDTVDANWETDFSFTVPEGLRSGFYAARLSAGGIRFDIPFFVRPPAGKPAARIALVAATATYTVYMNYRRRFTSQRPELTHGRLTVMDATDIMFLEHPEMGLSTYDVHSDGSGVAYASPHRPTHNVRPDGWLWNYCADCFVVDWLEHEGLPYDVITDDDIHAEGLGLLSQYRAVLTGMHPEYMSLQMIDAYEAYLRRGGRLMYMGGNGFYWRIAYHPTRPGVIEVRRSEDGLRAWDAEVGEYYHSFTGEYGGLWRRQARAPNRLVGVGFIAQGFDASEPYRRTAASHDPRAAFVFAGIGGEVLGDYGVMQGGAAGLEIDCADPRLGTPPHALILASSGGHSNVYDLVSEEINIPHGALGALHNPKIRADMVFYETPGGGAVFSTGSCAFAGSLGHNGFDNDIARLSGNVLRRFADDTPFTMPQQAGRAGPGPDPAAKS